MKFKFTIITLSLAALSISKNAVAQNYYSDTSKRFEKETFRTWSIGINGGMLTHYTPFNGPGNGDFRTPEEAFGYGGYIKKQVLPGFGFQADFLAGKVRGYQSNLFASPSQAQNNSRFDTRIEWSAAISGNLTVANLSLNKKRNFLSPYFTGGAGYMSYNAVTIGIPAVTNAGYQRNWFIPIGAGFKFGLSKGINLDLGYTVAFMKTSGFDGVAGAMNDRFSYAHGGFEFALGRRKSSQLQNYSAIAALREQSAAESADLRAQIATNQATIQSNQQQYTRDLGDSDGDGVANKFDKCPSTSPNTAVDGSGCPLKTPAPQITQRVIITEADRRVVNDAIKNLEFDLGKATLKESSYPTLNRVASLLTEKNFSLTLAGHTDNTSSNELNLKLSKDRAEAVKAYLVSKGANASRIEATGYGSTQPIASNKTAAGRQKNRRVEFSLL